MAIEMMTTMIIVRVVFGPATAGTAITIMTMMITTTTLGEIGVIGILEGATGMVAATRETVTEMAMGTEMGEVVTGLRMGVTEEDFEMAVVTVTATQVEETEEVTGAGMIAAMRMGGIVRKVKKMWATVTGMEAKMGMGMGIEIEGATGETVAGTMVEVTAEEMGQEMVEVAEETMGVMATAMDVLGMGTETTTVMTTLGHRRVALPNRLPNQLLSQLPRPLPRCRRLLRPQPKPPFLESQLRRQKGRSLMPPLRLAHLPLSLSLK
jgi:hypothetical protein